MDKYNKYILLSDAYKLYLENGYENIMPFESPFHVGDYLSLLDDLGIAIIDSSEIDLEEKD